MLAGRLDWPNPRPSTGSVISLEGSPTAPWSFPWESQISRISAGQPWSSKDTWDNIRMLGLNTVMNSGDPSCRIVPSLLHIFWFLGTLVDLSWSWHGLSATPSPRQFDSLNQIIPHHDHVHVEVGVFFSVCVHSCDIHRQVSGKTCFMNHVRTVAAKLRVRL